ncbi:MAG: efflux RND transporter periplasmic adaptor subunit [Verrucomicrobia bacterium]|nr:efflux RND transporter periplasmic adaptor subunit [Verrucomicrobiota bacterium]
MKGVIIITAILFIALTGCKSRSSNDEAGSPLAVAKTPVQVAYPTDTASLSDQVNLTAIANYLLKSDVKANATGYITKMTIKPADNVRKGQLLFALQTKEARALGNTINKLDPSFRFSGGTTVVSPASGYVEMVNHQVGDYVQDGEVLATITDASSFGFVMNVPYEYNQLIRNNKQLIVNLPDGRNVGGYVAKIMPVLDSISQTQRVLVKVLNDGSIPQNLIANIVLNKQSTYGLAVPRPAVLSDETQSSFWVMKLINDSTAVKTEIEKGIETNRWVQVKSGNISVKDRLVTSGNYGLGDTAFIRIER